MFELNRREWILKERPAVHEVLEMYPPRVNQNPLSNLLQASYTLCLVKTISPNLKKPPTHIAEFKTLSEMLQEDKTEFPIFYKPPTCFGEVETNSPFFEVTTDKPIFYKPPAFFAEVKTDYPNFYKHRTRFGGVKTDSPNFYKPKLTLRTSTRFLHTLYF